MNYNYFYDWDVKNWIFLFLYSYTNIDVIRFHVNLWLIYWLFICLDVSSHSIIFHSFGDVTIAIEGLQMLTYARHWWSLSSEGSLACLTYYDGGHPFKMVNSEDPVTLTPNA